MKVKHKVTKAIFDVYGTVLDRDDKLFFIIFWYGKFIRIDVNDVEPVGE